MEKTRKSTFSKLANLFNKQNQINDALFDFIWFGETGTICMCHK